MENRRPAEVFHPGEYLLDELNARGWTQAEFSEIINRPYRLVNEIIKGKRGITPETAKEFSAALGTSAEYWMNLESSYQLWKTSTDTSAIAHRAKLRNAYPIREMSKRGWISLSEDTQVSETQLLRFFEISKMSDKPGMMNSVAGKRSGMKSEEFTPVQIAWVYRVKHIAQTLSTRPYSEKLLRDSLIELKKYTEFPENIENIPQLLDRCGVKFVIVEPLSSSKIDGVTFWENDFPVIGMTLRFDRIDNFWFVLRHEIEHVLNGDARNGIIIDDDLKFGDIDITTKTESEIKANNAAAEFCVPQNELIDFINRNYPIFSRERVIGFARNHHVHPGIVVGQIQIRKKRFDLFRPMLVSIRNYIITSAITDGYGYIFPNII